MTHPDGRRTMIGSPLDQFAGVSTLIITALMILVDSRRGQLVLAILLAVIWFAWHIERSGTS